MNAKVHKLAREDNEAYADALRRLADMVEHSAEPIQGYAGIVVYADGSIGTEFFAPRHVTMVGALRHMEHRILKEWDDE